MLVSSVFLFTNAGLLNSYFNLKKLLKNNECGLIEGKVTDFVRMDPYLVYLGKQGQKFKVGSIEFEIWDGNSGDAGYNKTLVKGGLIKPGSNVKIYYKSSARGGRPAIAKVLLAD